MIFAGGVARIFTSMQETGDLILIVNFSAGATMSAILLFQESVNKFTFMNESREIYCFYQLILIKCTVPSKIFYFEIDFSTLGGYEILATPDNENSNGFY